MHANWLPHLFFFLTLPVSPKTCGGLRQSVPMRTAHDTSRLGVAFWLFWLFWLRLTPMIGLLPNAQRREAEKNSNLPPWQQQATETIPDVISLIRPVADD